MHIIQLDLQHGLGSIDSSPIELCRNGLLVDSIAKLCSPASHVSPDLARYCLLRKVSVCGHWADCVIEVEEGRTISITFLFDLVEFFGSSILESKTVRTCEKSWKLNFQSATQALPSWPPANGAELYFFMIRSKVI